jgi:hypothetical protein
MSGRRGRRGLALLAVAALASSALAAGEVPAAVVVLEVLTRALPDEVPEAAPPRFALLEDGQVFVGGTSRLLGGRLSGREVKDLERRLAGVRKLPGLAGSVRLGDGERRQRLRMGKVGGRPLALEIVGDPARAAPAQRPLAALIADLERFTHPSLRAYQPASYALSARAGTLRGGCRTWRHRPGVAEGVFAPVSVPAAFVEGWPTGASPASVCAGAERFVVTFRPLLPGERP